MFRLAFNVALPIVLLLAVACGAAKRDALAKQKGNHESPEVTTSSDAGVTLDAADASWEVASTPEQAAEPAPIAELAGWMRQYGTEGSDSGQGVAVDGSGNVYVVGYTGGSLQGVNAGSHDVFIRKHGSAGDLIWTRQFGTSSADYARAVAVDSNGNLYVAGFTSGSLYGVNAGRADAFIGKYDGEGNELWAAQFGTANSDYAVAVAIDGAGNVYVVGYTTGSLDGVNAGRYDAFVRKYDGSGSALWTRQFGTEGIDYAHSVACDGDVIVAGLTQGALSGHENLGGSDGFIRKYDGEGNPLWTQQFGTEDPDFINAVAVEAGGNVYVAGYTDGALFGTSLGASDAFIRKYGSSGDALWARQFGTNSHDTASAVLVDANANVVVAGYTFGALPGQTILGDADAFVCKYDGDGNPLWAHQFGTRDGDFVNAVAMDDDDASVYVVGYTEGSLSEQANAGYLDVFLLRLPSP